MRLPGLFITGTDTGVGKTYVTALLIRELLERGVNVGAYKPACSGSVPGPDGRPLWEDVETLAAALGGRFSRDETCPQRFAAPLAPPVAARLEGRAVDAGLLRAGAERWQGKIELLLVEGAGGLLCPLTERETVADLALDLGLPLVIVARLGLGTINHTLLTVEVARGRGLSVAGIVFNQGPPVDTFAVEGIDQQCLDLSSSSNPREVAARVDVPVLGVVATDQSGGLLRAFAKIKMEGFDWSRFA